MLKLATLSLVAAMAAPIALAGPAERFERLDNRLDHLERIGVIKQGSYLDRLEDRIDRRENKIDRREDRRDRKPLEVVQHAQRASSAAARTSAR